MQKKRQLTFSKSYNFSHNRVLLTICCFQIQSVGAEMTPLEEGHLKPLRSKTKKKINAFNGQLMDLKVGCYISNIATFI